MIYNFGSISDLYNKIKILTNRVTNTEAVDVTQNTRMTDIEAVNTAQNTRMTNIESVNTAQNTRMTNIENKLISSTKALSTYITMSSGFTLGNGSFIRMYGNVVDMVLVISGSAESGVQTICKIRSDILPYASNFNRVFDVQTGWNVFYPFTVNSTSGDITTEFTSRTRLSSVRLNMMYII